MSYRDNSILSLDEEVRELNAVLRQQHTYYKRLHYWNITPLDVDIHYDNLKDWARFKEPREKRIANQRTRFNQRQAQNHNTVGLMKNDFRNRDAGQVTDYFKLSF